MEITSKKGMIRNNGVHIHYEVVTPTTIHRTLLFVHGLGGDHTVWKSQVDYFTSRGYRCISIDLRGHGLSDHPIADEEYGLIKFADDIHCILESEGIRKVTPIGHCLGGMVSLMFAVNFPQNLSGLILIDTSYQHPDYLDIVMKQPYLYSIFRNVLKYSPRFYQRRYMNTEEFKGTGDLDARRIMDDLRRISLRIYLSICDSMTQYTVADALNKIQVPTLIIHGLKDTIIPFTRSEILHKKIHKSQLTFIPDANHILVINNTDEISAVIFPFLQKLRKADRI